jgi:regulation of enolase protein 1 (concanavalin A-like superfamily)
MNAAQIFEVWQRVAEDFAPFNICITTDQRVYDNAAEGQRIRSIVTPTKTAYPIGGGNAFLGSFNWNGDPTCWTYYQTPQQCADACSHEIGHTLGLLHHGTSSSPYWQGGGTGVVSWAPLMGVSIGKNLTQWAQGEYPGANNPTQDDVLIIATQNNAVTATVDDFGNTLSGAGFLNILSDNTVLNEGVIETRTDVDAFRFQTTGGAVSLQVIPAVSGPNLDIQAELCRADTGAVIDTDNGVDAINATVGATLAAGEYLLKISGVGRGVPSTSDGYSDYGSLGTYKITGSAVGGNKPDRFTIAENSGNGTSVGTVAPRVNHGNNELTYSLANGTGAFAIDDTGALTVADSAQIDFEQVSRQWDDLPTFALTVNIVDTVNGSLNESIRVIVTLTDVNEPPTALAATGTVLEHSKLGLQIVHVSADDPDALDFPSFQITAGNGAGLFAIDQLGNITLAAALDLAADADYNLTVSVRDQGAPALSVDVSVAIQAIATVDGYVPGTITRTIYDNIAGATVASLASAPRYPGDPDREWTLTEFKGELVNGASFGSLVRGYLIPPATGNYEFWIASNDAAELWLSTDTNPANAVKIAFNTTFTDEFNWTAAPSQHSATITLTKGTAYYIEARHKQDINDDHIAVAWAGPGITQQVIPGAFLAPKLYLNYPPHIAAATYTARENAISGWKVGTVLTTDVNAGELGTNFQIVSGNTGNVFQVDPITGILSVRTAGVMNAATTPSYTLTISVEDDGNPTLSTTGTITVNVQAAGLVNKPYFVVQRWLNTPGAAVSDLTSNGRYPYSPDSLLESAFIFVNNSTSLDNYGVRIRLLVKPPTTGAYTFYVSSDDAATLYVSTDATAANATLAASNPTATTWNTYTTFPSQTSTVRNLVAGQKYYLELVMKESTGVDHYSVAWTGPNITNPSIIGNPNIEAFDLNTGVPTFGASSYTLPVAPLAANNTAVGSVTAVDPESDAVAYAITSGNTNGAFKINSATGAIAVANSAALVNFAVFNLTVTAQDYGYGFYPLKSSSVPVQVYVASANVAPTWNSDPFSKAAAASDVAYAGTLVGSATDLNVADVLTYSKVSGPAWLNVAANGILTGTPTTTDAGANAWVVRVTDGGGLFDNATLNISVSAQLPAGYTASDIGTVGLAGSAAIAGSGFTQNGAGVGLNAKADAGHFLRQSLVGDGEIRAQISSFTNGSTATTGVMFRESTAINSRVAFVGVKAGNFILTTRTSSNSNASTTTLAAAGSAPNQWVRLSLSGDNVNVYTSADGATWTNRSTVTIAFPATTLVGLWTSSGNTTTRATTVTSNVSITPFPAPWVTNQLGTVSAKTSSEFYNNIYSVNGAGTLGGSSSDAGTFLNQTMSGDGQIIARITSMPNTGTAARFGVVIRDGTATGARSAFMGISPDGTFRFQTRSSTNGATTTTTGGTGTAPNYWVKLVRAGNVFTGFKSSNGTTWTQVGPATTINMATGTTFGLINGSGSTSTLNKATADNVTATP